MTALCAAISLFAAPCVSVYGTVWRSLCVSPRVWEPAHSLALHVSLQGHWGGATGTIATDTTRFCASWSCLPNAVPGYLFSDRPRRKLPLPSRYLSAALSLASGSAPLLTYVQP